MGRPKKYKAGVARTSISLPTDLYDQVLKVMEIEGYTNNFSGFVVHVFRQYLEGGKSPTQRLADVMAENARVHRLLVRVLNQNVATPLSPRELSELGDPLPEQNE